MDKRILVNNKVNEFVLPIYGLNVSRVWRGYANVIFFELGELNENKGVFTLWVETSFWKIIESDRVFDGNKESYEKIDLELSKFIGQKITEFIYFSDSKTFGATFNGGKKLVCTPSKFYFVSIILNSERKYLNFEIDGSTNFEIFKKSSRRLPE